MILYIIMVPLNSYDTYKIIRLALYVSITQFYKNPTNIPARITETIVTLINPPTSMGGSM